MSKRIKDGLTNSQRSYRKHRGRLLEAHRLRMRSWRARNPERSRQHTRNSYRRNIYARRAAKARYYLEVVKPNHRTIAGRAKVRHQSIRRRARLQCVPRTLTVAEWQRIKAAYNHRCAYCVLPLPLEMDHVVPLTKGGAHSKENVVPACKSCNSSKGNRASRPLTIKF